jgi:hypothetical protein
MANIVSAGTNNTASKKRTNNVHLDMTPMVDLAFLLVTFFVLATSMKKPSVMEIIYPDENGVPSEVNDAITLLLPEDGANCIYYQGMWKGKETTLLPTDFSKDGLRKILLDQNTTTILKLNKLLSQFPADRAAWSEQQRVSYLTQYRTLLDTNPSPTVIIKTLPATPFAKVVAAWDELQICSIQKRVVQDMNEEERQLFEQQ